MDIYVFCRYVHMYIPVCIYVCTYVCFWSREDVSKQEVTKPPQPEVILIFFKCSYQREQS